MFWGKLANATVSLLALSTLAGTTVYAAQSPQERCDKLGQKFNHLTSQAQSLGYFSMHQPIVVAGGSTGLSEDQARDASQKKVAELRAWLAGSQQVLDQSGAQADCVHRLEAQKMIDYGKSLLASLLSFQGPYTEAQNKLPTSPASVGNAYVVNLPCRQKGAPESGLRECGEVIRDVTGWTEGYLKKMIDAIYHGCDLADSTTVTDPANCQAKSAVQTCNYFEGLTQIANTAPEQSTNHIGKSCGHWISVGQRISGSQCMISASSMGTLEQSFYQGNAIRSLDCHWKQVKNELSQGKLRLTAAAGIDPAKHYQTQIELIKKGQEKSLAHKNVAQVEMCTSSDLESASAAKQSSCMEYTHRLVLEQHLAHLASIEVINRARRSFERFDAGTKGRAFFADFKNYLQQNQGSSACSGKSSDCNSGSSAYLTRCYKPLWQKFFTDRSNSVWNQEVCQ